MSPNITLKSTDHTIGIDRGESAEASHTVEGLTPEQVIGVEKLVMYWGMLMYHVGQNLARAEAAENVAQRPASSLILPS